MRSIALLHTYLVSSFWRISTTVFKTCRYLRTKFFRAQGSIRVNFLFHFRMSHNRSFAARGKKSLPSILRGRMKYCYSDSMIKVRTRWCVELFTACLPIQRNPRWYGHQLARAEKKKFSWLEDPNEIYTRNTPYCSLINSRDRYWQ